MKKAFNLLQNIGKIAIFMRNVELLSRDVYILSVAQETVHIKYKYVFYQPKQVDRARADSIGHGSKISA